MPFEKTSATNPKAEYSLMENGHVKVVNSNVNKDGKYEQVIGEAKYKFNPKIAHLKVSMSKIPIWKWLTAGDYRVMKTDYKNYAVVYSTGKILWKNYAFFWVLVRDPKYTGTKA